ncbi:hypothetical protein [Butyrivibrio sp. M55]|uniref:hypothetical protein n=1 Tax=Butyrivibrio sp. M55 TaxID=1855323 RepID=UPI0008EE4CA8|nr:hypothetical protein [Butyrivibrio sp. M55]SFU66086.1 hypothetical protein SAMN05216540_105158 [Butyrivibrio sp. M55]
MTKNKKSDKLPIFGLLISALFNYICLKICNMARTKSKSEARKYEDYYKLLAKWMVKKQQGKNITNYLYSRGFKEIAIYGMKEVGQILLGELDAEKVEVKYAIDQSGESSGGISIEVYYPNDLLDKVDAIVVTPIYYFDDIKRHMETKIGCPIISIEEIIDKC